MLYEMHVFQIEPNVMPQPQPDVLADTCWLAREILATYMGEACEIDVEGDEGDEKDLLYDGGEEGLTVHDTPTVPISAKYQVSLSNMALVTDPRGKIIPLTDSGYVALRAEDREDFLIEKETHDEGRGQIIFRLSQPGYGSAAVFAGYSIETDAEIPPEDTARLHKIQKLLTYMKGSLRLLVENNKAAYDALYHSNSPRMLSETTLGDDDLSSFFK